MIGKPTSESNFSISQGAKLAAQAWNEFGPKTACVDSVYNRARKKLKVTPQDKKDFHAHLLNLARNHRGVISHKGCGK